MLPLVSIIIPAYNCGKYLGQAIDSVLNQTYLNIEIIIADDGSTDNTRSVFDKCVLGNSDKISYFYQKNKGPASARNLGLKNAHGEYIAFLDADDLWKPEKLEKSINFLKENGFDWICTAMIKDTGDGNQTVKRIPADSWVINSSTHEIKQLKNGLFFFSDIAVHTPTIIAKRKCFDLAGIFDESFLVGEDTDLWLRFEEKGLRGGYLDEALTFYRYNPRSITKGKIIDGLDEHAKVAKKHALILGINNQEIRKSYANFLWQVADRYFSSQQFPKSFRYIMRAVYYNPKYIIKALLSLLKRRVISKRGVKNILYYEPTTGFGGSSRCLLLWLNKLDTSKFKPLVLVHYDGPTIKQIKRANVKVINIPFRSIYLYNVQLKNNLKPFSYLLLIFDIFIFDIPTIVFMLVIALKYKIDLFHLNSKVLGVIPGIITAKLLRKPCVVHLHDTKNPIRRERLFGNLVDCFIALNVSALNLYREAYSGRRLELIYNGIDVNHNNISLNQEEMKERFNIESGVKVVGIVGRLVEGKGFDDFIQAAKILIFSDSKINFLIVGDAPDKSGNGYVTYLKNLVNEAGIEKKVIFTGWQEETKNIMSIFDVFVQASSTFPEGLSMTIIEAMALQKAVVATNIAGSSDAVVDGITGYLIPPGNQQKLAEAIGNILNNASLRNKMQENALIRVKEHFNSSITVRKIETLYESMLNGRCI